MVALDAGQLGYVFGDESGSDRVDLLGGFQPVADFEAFVVELTADDVEVEVDYDLAVVGLLADDVGECGWPAPIFPVASVALMAHTFYCRGWMVGCQGQGRGKGEVHNSVRVHCALNIGVDVQSVALHEFGHLAGLAHTTDDDAAMYPGFPILVVFRLKGQSKRDGSIIVTRRCITPMVVADAHRTAMTSRAWTTSTTTIRKAIPGIQGAKTS